MSWNRSGALATARNWIPKRTFQTPSPWYSPELQMTFFVRSATAASRLTSQVVAAVAGLENRSVVYDVVDGAEIAGAHLAASRSQFMLALLLAAMQAAFAVGTLAAAVVSWASEQRLSIVVRALLGADASRLMRFALLDLGVAVSAGTAIGAVGAGAACSAVARLVAPVGWTWWSVCESAAACGVVSAVVVALGCRRSIQAAVSSRSLLTGSR